MTTECIPSAWRNSILVPIFKEKGDVQECKNYRGIKLLTHTFKIWEKVVDRSIAVRANIHLVGADPVLPEWIRWGRGVVAEFFRDPYSVGGKG